MTAVDVEIFRLVDPTPEQETQMRLVISLINFPWGLIRRENAENPILVTWEELPQGASGMYTGGIQLSNNEMHAGPQVGFVFAHEVGHLVDSSVLTDKARAAIIVLMHEEPFIQLGHFDHDHPDAEHGSEYWFSGPENSYVSRIHECHADQFVAAFAPTIWDGTGIGSGSRYPRFVHWTEKHAEIRRLTLPPPQEPTAPEEVIMTRGVYIDRALKNLVEWRRDHPRNKTTWAKVYIAKKSLESIKQVPKP